MKSNASTATGKGRWLAYLATAIAFALCLLAAAGLASAAQPGVDPNAPSDLKVTVALEDAQSFIDTDAGMQVDAYLVARAEQAQGSDAYTYVPVEGGPFADLDVTALNKAIVSKDSAATTKASQQLAQEALAAALADLSSPASTLANAPHASMHVADGSNAACEADFQQLPGGLYLLVTHGANLSADDYVTTLPNGKTVTVAYSPMEECIFEPVLVPLTVNEADAIQPQAAADGTDLSGSDLAMLKPETVPRMGSLEIVKTLDRFETDGTDVDKSATFVFSVQAIDVDGKKVYDNVVSLVFDQPGSKSVLIENKIPAGATATVREVYSGAAYQVVGSSEGTAVIVADQVAQVSFANTNDNVKVHGGSVTNSFTYGKGGWEFTPAYSQDAAASED